MNLALSSCPMPQNQHSSKKTPAPATIVHDSWAKPLETPSETKYPKAKAITNNGTVFKKTSLTYCLILNPTIRLAIATRRSVHTISSHIMHNSTLYAGKPDFSNK